MHILVLAKMSAPGWIKEFTTEDELEAEFVHYVCDECMQSIGRTKPSFADLLSTNCGLEFDVYDA